MDTTLRLGLGLRNGRRVVRHKIQYISATQEPKMSRTPEDASMLFRHPTCYPAWHSDGRAGLALHFPAQRTWGTGMQKQRAAMLH